MIMSHVPVYVYVLFVVLLWMGLARCFPRTIRVERLMVMPVLMAVLGIRSFLGLFPTVGLPALAAGLAGLVFGATIGSWHVRRWKIEINRQTRSIALPGDVAMLGLIMATFVFEFLLHYGIEAHAAWSASSATPSIAAAIWGLLIGMSLGRNMLLGRRYLAAHVATQPI
jgi:hypothetical protein